MLGSKFAKFISFLKQQIRCFSNFASLFSVMKQNHSALLWLDLYVISAKGAYHSTNLVKFHMSSCKSEIRHFDGMLLFKLYRFSAKKVLIKKLLIKSDANFKEKLPFGFKHDMSNSVNFHQATQKSENFILMCSVFPNCTKFELKNIEELSFITLNSDSNLSKPYDLMVSKLAWGIRWNFIRALRSLKICTLIFSLCPKHLIFRVENIRGIMCHDTEWRCKT